jgi:methylated-DNA-[protein]-cysteine S-methyltransferase
MKYCLHSSPLGPLMLVGDGNVLHCIGLPEGKGRLAVDSGWEKDDTAFPDARRQLDEYFAGERTEFQLVLKPSGTRFQLEVLEALRAIPYGETRSYRDIAQRVGRPRAVRAVGAANGRNPLPIVIPCHRVIGADGSLTGFGGGLAAKLLLLELEARHAHACAQNCS